MKKPEMLEIAYTRQMKFSGCSDPFKLRNLIHKNFLNHVSDGIKILFNPENL